VIFAETSDNMTISPYTLSISTIMNPVSPIGAMLGNFKLKVGYDDQFYETSYITDFTGQRIEFVKPEGLLTLSFTPSSITLYPGTYAST